MQAALRSGNSLKASQIQQQLQREQAQENTGQAGEVAAENNFQNDRANDYIAQAESWGRAQAATLRQQPLSGVTQSGNYLFSLQNPDFSTYTPNADTSRLRYGEGIKRDTPRAVTVKGAVNPDPTGSLANIKQNAYNIALAQKRHEQDFKAGLPPELAKVYDSYTGSMTPKEQTDFFGQSPEMRYSKLRYASVKGQRSPQTIQNTGGEIEVNGERHNYRPNGQETFNPSANLGDKFSDPMSYSSPTMPTIKPVTSSRPAATLVPVSDWWNQVDKPSTGF